MGVRGIATCFGFASSPINQPMRFVNAAIYFVHIGSVMMYGIIHSPAVVDIIAH